MSAFDWLVWFKSRFDLRVPDVKCIVVMFSSFDLNYFLIYLLYWQLDFKRIIQALNFNEQNSVWFYEESESFRILKFIEERITLKIGLLRNPVVNFNFPTFEFDYFFLYCIIIWRSIRNSNPRCKLSNSSLLLYFCITSKVYRYFINFSSCFNVLKLNIKWYS